MKQIHDKSIYKEGRRDCLLPLRLSRKHATLVRRLAKLANKSVAQVIREMVLQALGIEEVA